MTLDAIVLAGGKGSRMDDELPKPLVDARGKAIIERQIDYLKDKVDRIILSLGLGFNQITEKIDNVYGNTPRILYSVEYVPLGTAGGLKRALDKTDADYLIVLNCDDIADVDISKLAQYKENTRCVKHPRLPYGLVEFDQDGYLRSVEKPVLEDRWASIGWYLFKRDGLEERLPDNGMLERDVFDAGIIKMRGYIHEGFWMALNSKKDIAEFEKASLPDSLR